MQDQEQDEEEEELGHCLCPCICQQREVEGRVLSSVLHLDLTKYIYIHTYEKNQSVFFIIFFDEPLYCTFSSTTIIPISRMCEDSALVYFEHFVCVDSEPVRLAAGGPGEDTGAAAPRSVRFSSRCPELISPSARSQSTSHAEDFYAESVTPFFDVGSGDAHFLGTTLSVAPARSGRATTTSASIDEITPLLRRTAIFCRLVLPVATVKTGASSWRLSDADRALWTRVLAGVVDRDRRGRGVTAATRSSGVSSRTKEPADANCAAVAGCRPSRSILKNGLWSSSAGDHDTGAAALLEEYKARFAAVSATFSTSRCGATSAAAAGTQADESQRGPGEASSAARAIAEFVLQLASCSGYAFTPSLFASMLLADAETFKGIARTVPASSCPPPMTFPSCVSWECDVCTMINGVAGPALKMRKKTESSTDDQGEESPATPAFCVACGAYWNDAVTWQCDCGAVCRFDGGVAVAPVQRCAEREAGTIHNINYIEEADPDVHLALRVILGSVGRAVDPDADPDVRPLFSANVGELELPPVGHPECPQCGWLRPVVRAGLGFCR